MAQYVDRLQVPLLVGVGAAFDYHTGRIPDCSEWIKRGGLQWLHRLMHDPRRLWKRYLRNNPAFLWHVAWQISGLREYPRRRETHPPAALHHPLRESASQATPLIRAVSEIGKGKVL